MNKPPFYIVTLILFFLISATPLHFAQAQTAITIGETAVLTINDSGNGNLLIAQQATLSQSATIQSLSFYVTTASGDLRLGIYDATGPSGGPGAKIAETNSFTPTTGWNTATVITPVSLPPGTYWLAYLPSSSSLAFKKILTGSAKWYSYTYGVMPGTYSTAPSGSDSVHWSFYATLNTSTSPDTTAPSIPTGLSATAVSSSQINLSWTASTDNVGVTGYGIYRGGIQIASVASLSYNDTGLTASTAYSYTVAAYDAAGKTSTQSASASATTQTVSAPDTTAPSTPTGLTATAVSSSQINLSWTASTDNVGVTGYRVERCQGGGCTTFAQVGTPTVNSYSDTSLTASTAYTYRVRAVDAVPNLSAYGTSASATTQAGGTNPIDSLQPGQWYMVPNSNVSAIDPCPLRNCNYSGNGGQKDVIRSWNGGAYDTKRDQLIVWGGGHAAYFGNELYGFNVNTLKWAMLTTPSTNISLNGEAYPDGRPNARHTYSGVLYATNIDKFWASSGSVGDSGGCSSGTWMYDFSALPPESGWARQLDYPGEGKCGAVSAYDPATGLVWFNGKAGLHTFNPSNTSSPWVQRNPEFSVPLYLSVAIDTKRKKLVMIGGGYAFIHDISSSGTVLRQNMTTSGAKEIESAAAPGLAYDPVSDRMIAWNGGSNVYVLNMDTLVWENRAPAGSNTVTPTQVTASGGTFSRFQYIPSKNAFIAVNATTENVYIYKLSSGGGITPLPTVSLGASPTSVTSGSSATLTWSSTNATSCTASGGWSGAKGTSGTQSITNITTTSTYTLTCTGTGGTTSQSATITVTGAGDTTPPSTPTNLSATAVSTSQINLSWTASTDNVGVTGYDIYRGGIPLVTVTGTSYSNTGLTASTLYSYTVRAIDAAGNVSVAQSTSASATTQPLSSATFTTGDRVQVSSGPLNVRTTASATGVFLGTQATGALGTVVGGPIAADGFTWWNVNYDTGVDGWSAENFLVKYTPPPPPTGAVGGYPMPTLQDERTAYTSWGWTWGPSVEPAAVVEPVLNYYVDATGVDVRNDPEADDLWNYLMMYRRTGNQVYLNRANAWLRYFKQDYVTDVVNDDAVNNHLFGWGLIAWYEHTCEQGACDTAALSVAEQIGALAEQAWAGAIPGQTAMAYYGARRAGRPLLLATRLAEVTKKQRWIDLRDRLINSWIQSPDWDTRGIYEIGQSDTDAVAGAGAYAAGYRVQSAFQIGILSEAFDYVYRATGNTVLRDRIISMARFVNQYGLDATYQYTGSYFGLSPSGNAWHNNFANCGTVCTSADPAYTTSLVDTLVRGYKYTGDATLLSRAKIFFNRGTKGVYGSLARSASDNGIHHFVDTRFSSDQFYLGYNKGELQYTSLVFENGGNPTIIGTTSPLPTVTLTSNPTSVTSGSSSTLTWSSTNATSCTASGGWSGVKATSGTQSITTITTTATYTLTCTGTGGTTNSSVTITVTAGADTTVPTTPAGLTATAVSSSQINLSWTASVDPSVAGQTTSGVAGYRIYRSGVQIATSPTTSYSNTGLTSGTTYSYRVAAVDGATPANVSLQSAQVSATTQTIVTTDTTPPTVSFSAPANNTTVSGTITVSGSASDNIGITGVQFKLDNANLGAEDTTSPYSMSWNTTSATNGTHTLLAVVRDAAGNRATSTGATIIVSNTTPDTTNPIVTITTPTTLATYIAPSGTVTMGGTATDNIGITQVSWSNSAGGTGTMTGTASWSTTLTLQSGANTITVTGRDLAGNFSTDVIAITYTPIVSDTQIPTTPSNLTAAAVSTSQIDLTWSPSTDNIGVTGYRIYANNTQIATTTGTAYSHTNLSPFTTYAYTVSAFDAAGNTSSLSLPLSITTQAQAVIPPPSSGTTGGTTSGGGSTRGGGGGGGTSSGGGTTSTGTTSGGTALSGTASSSTLYDPRSTGETTPTQPTFPTLTGPFGIGQRGNQVKLLQQMLITDGSMQGEATGYYGSITQRAVETFQKKHNFVTQGSPSTTGYGLAGPGTRAKLNSLYAGGGSATSSTDRELLLASLRKQVEELIKILQGLVAKLAAIKAGQGVR